MDQTKWKTFTLCRYFCRASRPWPRRVWGAPNNRPQIIFVGTRSTCAISLCWIEAVWPSSQSMVTPLQDTPTTVPRSVALCSQQTRSPMIPESKLAGELSATTTASSKDETGAAPRQAAPGQHKTVTIIDGSSGARREVVIGTGDPTNGGSKISPGSR